MFKCRDFLVLYAVRMEPISYRSCTVSLGARPLVARPLVARPLVARPLGARPLVGILQRG